MKGLILAIALLVSPFLSQIAIGQDIIKDRNFPGEALYGFMNGGSDLFLEYGFVNLNVQEVKYEGYEYTLETYTMADEYAAFGIYSIHIHKPICVDSLLVLNGVKGFDCLSRFQLQAVCGMNYYSIIFNDGQKAAKGAQELLLKKIEEDASVIGTETNKIPTLLDKAEILKAPYSGRVKFVKGEIALSNADDSLVERFGLQAANGLWIYESLGQSTIVLDATLQVLESL